MKKEGVMKLFFILIISIFLLSGVFAVPAGTCAITARTACTNDMTNGYIVMGLAAQTNSHGGTATINTCNGHISCNGLNQNACNAQKGCNWVLIACTGSGEDCGDFSTQSTCTSHPSCSWNSEPTNYPYVLCCGFGTGSTTCTRANKIIGLSSSTNAHAESPSSSVYSSSNNICYGDLKCVGRTDSCGELELL